MSLLTLIFSLSCISQPVPESITGNVVPPVDQSTAINHWDPSGIEGRLSARAFVCADSVSADVALLSSTALMDSIPKPFSYSAQIMAFGRGTDFDEKQGSVNPGNKVAGLNKYEAGLYIRPELKYESRQFAVWVKPRLNLLADLDEKKIFDAEKYDARFYLQELKAKWQVNNNLYVLAGRYVKFLGTTAFFNPSNPYITDNLATMNPKLEVEPMDFVEVNVSAKKDWNFSIIANINDAGKAIYQQPFFKFKRSYGLFAEHYGESSNIGFITTLDEAAKYHLGWYGHKNINEAVVVWTDGALDHRINRFYPVSGHHTNLINYEMISGDENKRLFFTGLAGASFTFRSGPTFQLNYLYNGQGYNKEQFHNYQQMLSSSSDYNFEITRQLSNLNLGRSINTGLLYLRHHYIFGQLSDTDIFGQLNYNFRYLYSPVDRGSQVSSLIEWNLSNNLEVYCVSIANLGKRSDLRKLVRLQVMSGVIFKL